MTTTNENKSLAVAAASDLSAQATRYRAITIFGSLVAANVAAGVPGGAIGILTSSTRSGETASAVYQGITKAVAGAGITTPGWPIMVGSSGYIFAANSGFAHIGRTLESAASGDMVQVNVDFNSFPLWSGAA